MHHIDDGSHGRRHGLHFDDRNELDARHDEGNVGSDAEQKDVRGLHGERQNDAPHSRHVPLGQRHGLADDDEMRNGQNPNQHEDGTDAQAKNDLEPNDVDVLLNTKARHIVGYSLFGHKILDVVDEIVNVDGI